MTKLTFDLIDADGKKLHACKWIPDSDPIAVVALVHGLGDHIGRYELFSEFLNKNKIAVTGLDYQGHGKSRGKRGHVRSYDLLLSNIETLLIKARLEFNNTPIFLYGHSLGGNIVANYVLRHQSKEITGSIISSPFLELAFYPPEWKIRLAKILNGLWPSLTLSNELDPMELSHDPLVGKAYIEDPLVHEKISVSLYNNAINMGNWALENAELLNYPTLIMHGSEDRLTSHKASERFAKEAGDLATIKIWEGLRHEIHNEKNKEEIMNFICDWIRKYLPLDKLKEN
jgi:alpha-beta hydrolase superfamily lysophospholipase